MIESTRNPRVVKASKLKRAKERRERGEMLLEGPNVVGAALDASAAVKTVFTASPDALTARAAEAGAEVLTVSAPVLRKLADTDHPQGPVAVANVPTSAGLVDADTIVLWGVSDPGNAGTLVRSAAAFAFRVAVAGGTVDLWSPKVLRAAAGAHFLTAIAGATDLAALQAVGLHTVALVPQEPENGEPPLDGTPLALLVGNEAKGLPRKIAKGADSRLTVPTVTVESLNVAVAGSIAMFAVAQSRP